MNRPDTEPAAGKARWPLLFAGIHLAIFVYYWIEWGSFENFIKAIDHQSQFMQDFVAHYYPMGEQIILDPVPVPGFVNTAFFALVLAPISALSLHWAVAVWAGIQLACLAALCLISARGLLKLPPLGTVLYLALCTTSLPILHNFTWGQVSVPITLCVFAAFLLSNKNRSILAGILLAFAAAIKLYPALFILYFILKRDRRACLAFGLAFLVFYFGFPAATIGLSGWIDFEKTTSLAISQATWVSEDVNSQYIVHVGARWYAAIFGREASDLTERALALAGYGIALACITMAWRFQQQESWKKHGLSMVALFLSIPFLIQTSWPHYFVYLPPCQVAVFSFSTSTLDNSHRSTKVIGVLSGLSMTLSSVFLFNLFPGWAIYHSYGVLFLANLLLVIAVCLASASPAAVVRQNSVRLESERLAVAGFYRRRLSADAAGEAESLIAESRAERRCGLDSRPAVRRRNPRVFAAPSR